MDKTRSNFALCLGLVGFLTLPALSNAGQMVYNFKQNNGITLLTNIKKAEYSHLKIEKKTYYPDSNIHDYNNWGASEASVLPSYSRNKNAFDDLIRQAAQQHGISEGLIKAVMHTESGFNINARSPVGAQGLMQLMPATARRFNVSNTYDPQQNIFAGAKYLSWLLKRFNGNTQYAIAAYNAGEGNVDKYGGIPPFRETRDYVRRVTSRYQNLYASSLGSVNNTSSASPQVIAQSDNNTTEASTTLAEQPNYTRRIVQIGNSFSDAPKTYSTEKAIASATISFN